MDCTGPKLAVIENGMESTTLPSSYITRLEFEGGLNNLRDDLKEDLNSIRRDNMAANAALAADVKALVQARQVNWQLIVAILAVGGVLLSVGVRGLADLRGLQEWREVHQQFSDTKSDSIELGIAKLEARASANRQALGEQETQNKWQSDVDNLRTDYESRMDGAYCIPCRANDRACKEIEFPPPRYYPLAKIGEAELPNGTSH